MPQLMQLKSMSVSPAVMPGGGGFNPKGGDKGAISPVFNPLPSNLAIFNATPTREQLNEKEKVVAAQAAATLASMGLAKFNVYGNPKESYIFDERTRTDATAMAPKIYSPPGMMAYPENFPSAITFILKHIPTARQHPGGGQIAEEMVLAVGDMQKVLDYRQALASEEAATEKRRQEEAEKKRQADEAKKKAAGGDTPPAPQPTPTPTPGGWSNAQIVGAILVLLVVAGLGWAALASGKKRGGK